MDIESFRDYCLSLPSVEEATPFDEVNLVFKVGGKMFALCDIDDFKWINLKCDPQRAIELRELYEEVRPGWHMSKVHWNTVSVVGALPDTLLRQWTLDSYNLVVAGLPRKVRESIG